MGRLKKSSLLDSYNFGDIAKDATSGLTQMFQSFFSPDEFAGKELFYAVVISNPTTISLSEYKAMGYSGGAGRQEQSFKKFKVRITHSEVNPHALLENPCDITLAQDKCEQNALISAHTTVATPLKTGVNIGSYILISLETNPDGLYNLQTAKFIDLIDRNETGETTLSANRCATIKTYFKYGESYIPPPPIEITSTLRELAERYDKEDIPGKTTPVFAGYRPHNTYVSGGPPPAVKQPFDIWVKAFLVVANDLGLKVQITSGFRTQEQQEKLHQDYKSGKSKIIAACGTCSRHISGFAIDINMIDAAGNVINSKSDLIVWENTQLIKAVTQEPFFLTWGGTFNDPIHFEFNPKEWGANVEEILEQQRGRNANYDTENTGQTSSEQTEQDAALGTSEQELGTSEQEIPPEVLAAGTSDTLGESDVSERLETEETAAERARRTSGTGGLR